MVIKKTKSLCPECLRVVDAEVFEDQEKIMIKKNVPRARRIRKHLLAKFRGLRLRF
jgi:uncharacterized radical SAM superfamily Fe-S cluster-containing enzyme